MYNILRITFERISHSKKIPIHFTNDNFGPKADIWQAIWRRYDQKCSIIFGPINYITALSTLKITVAMHKIFPL